MEERRNEKGRKEGRMIVERKKGKGKERIRCLLKFLAGHRHPGHTSMIHIVNE
jgi:hypothetical protein